MQRPHGQLVHTLPKPLAAHPLVQVRCASVKADPTDSLTMFRQRVEEMPVDVAVFLNEARRAAESLAQVFNAPSPHPTGYLD